MGGKEKEREREHWCENVDFEIWVEMMKCTSWRAHIVPRHESRTCLARRYRNQTVIYISQRPRTTSLHWKNRVEVESGEDMCCLVSTSRGTGRHYLPYDIHIGGNDSKTRRLLSLAVHVQLCNIRGRTASLKTYTFS